MRCKISKESPTLAYMFGATPTRIATTNHAIYLFKVQFLNGNQLHSTLFDIEGTGSYGLQWCKGHETFVRRLPSVEIRQHMRYDDDVDISTMNRIDKVF